MKITHAYGSYNGYDRKSTSAHFVLVTKTKEIYKEHAANVILKETEDILGHIVNTMGLPAEKEMPITIFYTTGTERYGFTSTSTSNNIIIYESISFDLDNYLSALYFSIYGQNKSWFLYEGILLYLEITYIINKYEDKKISVNSLFETFNYDINISKMNYIPLKEAIINPKNCYLNTSFNERGAFIAFLFNNYDKEKVLKFIKTSKLRDIGEKSWKALEKKFLGYMKKFDSKREQVKYHYYPANQQK